MVKCFSVIMAGLVAVVVFANMAGANTGLFLYQNDFTTRTSLGPIGSPTSFGYTTGNLVGVRNMFDGTQDQWIRRWTGDAPVTIEEASGNQYAQIVSVPGTDGYYGRGFHQIGSTATLAGDVLRFSIDMSPSAEWGAGVSTSRGQYVYLGDDEFFEGQSGFSTQTASTFGFQRYTDTSSRFMVRAGTNGAGSTTDLFGTATVNADHWYRFVADLNLATNRYSLNVYDLGDAHPTLATVTPNSPVQSFADVGFIRNTGSAAIDLNGITSVGIAAFGPTSPAAYDNIVMSEPPPSRYSDYVLRTNPVLYWPLNEFEGNTAYDLTDHDRHGTHTTAGTSTLTAGQPGPRPTDGFRGMSDNNRAVYTTQSAYTFFEGLSGEAAVGSTYSMQAWVKFEDHSHLGTAQYALTRVDPTRDAEDDIVSATLRDAVGRSGVSKNALWWRGSGGSVSGGDELVADTWHHMLMVRDGEAETVQLYVDGELAISRTSEAWDSGALGDLFVVGARLDDILSGGANRGFRGWYDEVAVWDRALLPAEVERLYAMAVPEPGTFVLFALAALCLLPLRRRGRAR